MIESLKNSKALNNHEQLDFIIFLASPHSASWLRGSFPTPNILYPRHSWWCQKLSVHEISFTTTTLFKILHIESLLVKTLNLPFRKSTPRAFSFVLKFSCLRNKLCAKWHYDFLTASDLNFEFATLFFLLVTVPTKLYLLNLWSKLVHQNTMHQRLDGGLINY